ncbi:MAG: hypothetical protein F6K65_07655 [Moorea sp. SIO3C2]|nr:hypothetical protein [Moorena sp. SIO3C2]
MVCDRTTPATKDYLLSDTLSTIVAPNIPSALIGSSDWNNIYQTVQSLPSQLTITKGFGFECPLQSSLPQADILLCIGEEGRGILAENNNINLLPETFQVHPIWQRVCKFCTQWADPSSPLFDKIDHIWLEFDVNPEPAPIPLPSVFFDFFEYSILPGGGYQWVSHTALKLLLGRALSPEVDQCLFNCFESLPSGADVFTIGAMLARDSDVVRICMGLAPAEIIPYLNRIGWQGDTDELEALVCELAKVASSLVIDLDVCQRVLPKVGLECYVRTKTETEQLLDYLVKKGLCFPEKRDRILAYPGYIHQKQNPQQWPSYLKWQGSFLKRGYLSTFAKRLNHIKVVYQPYQDLIAKAYLALWHHWLPYAKLDQQNKI